MTKNELKEKTTYELQRLQESWAKAFIPNPNNYPQVNHKDENCINNCADNLEWCTQEYNNNYGTHNEKIRRTRRTNYNNNTSKKVFQYDLKNNLIKIFPSGKEVQRQLGFDQSCISACCLGKLKTYKGFIWRHKESVA